MYQEGVPRGAIIFFYMSSALLLLCPPPTPEHVPPPLGWGVCVSLCVKACTCLYLPIDLCGWGCIGVLNKNLQVSQCMTMNVYSRWVV